MFWLGCWQWWQSVQSKTRQNVATILQNLEVRVHDWLDLCSYTIGLISLK